MIVATVLLRSHVLLGRRRRQYRGHGVPSHSGATATAAAAGR